MNEAQQLLIWISLHFFSFSIREILKHRCLLKQSMLHSSHSYSAWNGRCFRSYTASVKELLLKQSLQLLSTILYLSTILSSSQHFLSFLSLFIVLSFLFLKFKWMFSCLFVKHYHPQAWCYRRIILSVHLLSSI